VIDVEQTIGQVNQMIGQLFNAVQALFLCALCAGIIAPVITLLGHSVESIKRGRYFRNLMEQINIT
jgi:putative ABC transport system permease protein